jgi:ABC-type glycerol-3-phosphate transport system substrate-binding protein
MEYNISDAYRLWNSGLTAFSFEGIATQIGALPDYPEVFDDTGVAPLPMPGTPNQKRVNEASPRIIVLVKKSPAVVKVAEDFLIFINQTDRKRAFLHTFGFMFPVEKKIAEDPTFITEDPTFARAKENVQMTLQGLKFGFIGGYEHVLARGL